MVGRLPVELYKVKQEIGLCRNRVIMGSTACVAACRQADQARDMLFLCSLGKRGGMGRGQEEADKETQGLNLGAGEAFRG